MGLFSHKEKTSPSGFFTVDQTPTDERSEADAINRPRTSTSSAGRTSHDTTRDNARHSTSSSSNHHGAGAGAGAGAGGAAAAAAAVGGAGAAGARRESRTSHDGAAAPSHADTTRSTGPLTNEVQTSPSRSSGLPAGAAPAAAASSSPQVGTGTGIAASPASTTTNRDINADLAGLPSVGREDESSGLKRGATLKERSAAPHSHHAQPGADAVLSEEQAKLAEHDHKYLQPVVNERRHIHEVEELERHRVVDRHVHHVQHHVQPLFDERHLETVHSYREVPVTHVEEVHANTPDDRALLARLNAQSMSTYTVVPHQRVRVDKGETQVVENVVNHYHTIVMPVWQRDLHEFYRLNSNFSPATMINPSGGPAQSASAMPQQHPNPASPSVQSGSFGTVSHPHGASVVPGGVSLMGPPQPREGHKLVPDSRPELGGESTAYEVEYVNREPVFTSSATHPVSRMQQGGAPAGAQVPGQGHGHGQGPVQGLGSSPSMSRHSRKSSLGRTTPGAHLPTTTGGHQPLSPASSQHQEQQQQQQQYGGEQPMTGLEHGMQNTNLGVAK